jgi:hypothetical protein
MIVAANQLHPFVISLSPFVVRVTAGALYSRRSFIRSRASARDASLVLHLRNELASHDDQ